MEAKLRTNLFQNIKQSPKKKQNHWFRLTSQPATRVIGQAKRDPEDLRPEKNWIQATTGQHHRTKPLQTHCRYTYIVPVRQYTNL